ncbi:hypothetical protein [Alloalcanivorax marinus]|uniref:hypothetical protein n=1 Tax=Alloalcanivorax marinus TaxID=1177169 RepID=UPI001932AEC7|nr:hypothetical protein [Alloalcanivorax marinus]MBL7251251.1 hypothetical protein [Alloalcanivorax marinus]
MKRPFRFLAIVGLLILSLVAAWRGGLLPGVPAPWHDDLRILHEDRDGTAVMVVELRNTGTRTRWRSEGEDHRIDIRRLGPTLYELDITQFDDRVEPTLRRRMHTELQLEPGRTEVGGFRFTEPGKPVQRQLVEIVLPDPAA